MTVWSPPRGIFYGGCLAVLAGVAVAMSVADLGTAWWVAGMALQLGSAVALGFALRAARHPRLDRRTRAAWGILSAGFGLFILAGILYAFFPPEARFPVPGDLVRIAFAPVVLAGVLTFPTSVFNPRDRTMIKLDVGTVVAAAFMLLWLFVVGPEVSARRLSGLAGAVALGFPAGDLALLAGAALVLLRGIDASLRRPLVLLATAITVIAAGDSSLAINLAGGPGHWRTPWQAACWTLGHLLLAAAAFEQCRPAATHRRARPRPSSRASLLPYVAIGIGYATMLVAATAQRNAYPWGGLVLGAGVMSACVLARQVLSLRENRAMAVTDGLTGLANRAHLRAALTTALARARRTGHSIAVLLLDMDDFKHVNDSLGHEAGDQLLIAVAQRLRRSVSSEDLVARLGGDEFAVLLHDVGSGYRAEAVAERVVTQLAEPVPIAGTRLVPGASVGVAISGPGELSATELVHRADVAMYLAKREGTGGWRRYTQGLVDRKREYQTLAAALRGAVERSEFLVRYQPIVTLPHGVMVGVEALVRWAHPTHGELPPLEFIPLAEDTGVITQLGDWVLEEACRQVLRWQDRYPLQLHVNVSASQLDGGYPERVLAMLRRLGFPPEQLVLELTESAAVNAPAASWLDALHDAGLRIALDDFGTGYSSLAHLVRLPVDILKIDRSFVAQLGGALEDSVVAETILRLSHALGLSTVAEGVETQAQATELAALGTRAAQGYYFARPMPAQALDDLLRDAPDGMPLLPAPQSPGEPAAGPAGSDEPLAPAGPPPVPAIPVDPPGAPGAFGPPPATDPFDSARTVPRR